MTERANLGEFEQMVLLALLRLRNNAYGVTIRREISERAMRDVSVGAIYTTLERMERKGFVSSYRGEATPERGGRAKRYYQIEAPGQVALDRSLRVVDRMRQGIVPTPGIA